MSTCRQLFFRQCYREILIHWRQPQTIMYAVLFFMMIVVFFPLTLPPDVRIQAIVLPGIFWTALLLAFLFSAERLFSEEERGILEQHLVSGYPFSLYVMPKLCVHGGMMLLPVLCTIPLLAVLFGLSFVTSMVLAISCLAGAPTLWLLCALSAAFCLGRSQKGVHMALILLPLALPLMIFGAGAAAHCGEPTVLRGAVALLLACSLLAIILLPAVIVTIIRYAMSA